MAATKTLTDSINWAKPFLNWASLSIGVNFEPALTSANQALQTIVGPPFIWPWNRSTKTFLTVVGQQDYNSAISNFGWLEAASIQLCGTITSVSILSGTATFQAINGFSSLANGGVGTPVTTTGCTTAALNGTFPLIQANATSFTVSISTPNNTESESGALATAGPIMPLEIKFEALTDAIEQDRPTFISTQESDESGTTFQFRLLPLPDLNYIVRLIYQDSPYPIVRLSDTWGIPDQLQYIYNYFFLFFMLDYFEDTRAARYRQLAVASLLARQSGLSATDRNLFLGNWLPVMQQETNSASQTNQGNQSRGI